MSDAEAGRGRLHPTTTQLDQLVRKRVEPACLLTRRCPLRARGRSEDFCYHLTRRAATHRVLLHATRLDSAWPVPQHRRGHVIPTPRDTLGHRAQPPSVCMRFRSRWSPGKRGYSRFCAAPSVRRFEADTPSKILFSRRVVPCRWCASRVSAPAPTAARALRPLRLLTDIPWRSAAARKRACKRASVQLHWR